MEMKPQKNLLGRNPLSDTPHQNRVWWKMGKGRALTPQVARRILIRIRWQVSEDRVVASLVARYIGARM